MSHEEMIELLYKISNTINTVRTDNIDGNWDKLMGCLHAVETIIDSLRGEEDGVCKKDME